MSCPGCYRENIEGFCLKCRKKLFGGSMVSPVLGFATPADENIRAYQQQSKRMSISGVQLKYSLRLEKRELVLTEQSGQYIIKPIPPAAHLANATQAPENERLTMQLAAQVFNIATADNALVYFKDGQPAYITRRFDVKEDGGKHLQEDFAQLSGRSKNTHGADFKYSGTYADIGNLIKKYVAAYLPAQEDFFRLVFFNYLVSNGDAHLKNFSLIQSATGDYRLTPAYDLMSTVLHMPNETDTALDLYDNDTDTAYYQTYGCYGYPDFMELAKRMGLMEQRAHRILAAMAGKTEKVTAMISRSQLSDEVKAIYLHCYLDKVKRIKLPQL